MSRSTRIQLIVFAVVLAFLATPFLIPLNVYRAPIERAASAALSRDVKINGALHLTLYPEIGLSLSDVTIANPAGARDAKMMAADHLVVGARLMPLFSGRLEVTELVLQKPVIHLEVAKGGATNWSFGTASGSNQPADATALNRIGFSHLNIKDGTITYYDADSGKSAALTEVTLSLDMADMAQQTLARPLTLGGTLTYNGEALKIDGRLDNFGQLMSAKTTGARISIQSNVINAEFTGQIGTEGNLSGALKLGAHSVRSFAAWLGSPMPPGNGFGLIALEGTFMARDGVYSLSHTHLGFDSMNVNGDVSLDTNPKVLTVLGRLTIDRLDLNPYLAPGAETDTVKAAKAKAANPDAPFALSGLKAVDADLTLVVGAMIMPHLKLDQALVKAKLEDGVLKADLSNLTAYGGKGKGTFTVDARASIPSFHQTLEMEGINAQPFLVALMNFNRITGKGSISFDLSSKGDSSKAVVGNLGGKGDIRFANGNFSGADLAAIARVFQSVLTGKALGAAVGGGAKTEFVKMGASFTLDHGVMQTKDFQMINPAVEMNGHGDVDFAGQTLEFHFEPKATKGIPGLKLIDIGVPFYVKGPWAKPSYGPDVRNLAKGIVQKLGNGAASPLDLLTQPALSLKSILGTGSKSAK
jgi:AsmA protein